MAARPSDNEEIPILRQTSDFAPDGSYQFAYETGNGIVVDENGHVKNSGPDQVQVVEGSFAYKSPEGQDIRVEYVADENGYQPLSDAIPSNT